MADSTQENGSTGHSQNSTNPAASFTFNFSMNPAAENASVNGAMGQGHNATNHAVPYTFHSNVQPPIWTAASIANSQFSMEESDNAIVYTNDNHVFPWDFDTLSADQKDLLDSIPNKFIMEYLLHHAPSTLESVLRFVRGLPEVLLNDLDDESKKCAICRGPYGENVSFNEGKPEVPVKLPCNHIFGKECLTILLSPKVGFWLGVRSCPLCRREIEGIREVVAVEDLYQSYLEQI